MLNLYKTTIFGIFDKIFNTVNQIDRHLRASFKGTYPDPSVFAVVLLCGGLDFFIDSQSRGGNDKALACSMVGRVGALRCAASLGR